MGLKRTNVYADEDDLAQIKENAKKRGVSEAEIIRQAIHVAAMSTRVWDKPIELPMFHGGGEPATKEAVRDAVAEGAAREK